MWGVLGCPPEWRDRNDRQRRAIPTVGPIRQRASQGMAVALLASQAVCPLIWESAAGCDAGRPVRRKHLQ